MSKIIRLFFAFFIFLSFSFNTFANIESKITESDIISSIEDVEWKLKFKNSFDKLSKTEKEKFLEYINNPKSIIEWLKNWDKNLKVEKSFSIEKSYPKERSVEGLYFNKATFWEKLSGLWIDLIDISWWVRYAHDWKKISYIENWNVNVKHLIPLADVSTSGEVKRIDGDKAYFITDIKFNFIHKYFWSTFSVVDFWVWWDVSWNQWGWALVK